MAKSKRGGKSDVAGYARYKTANKESSNRIARLTKLAKDNPNNEQIALAIKNVAHRRHTPKTRVWAHSMRRVAQIVKQFTGKFDKGLFSNDPKIHMAATRTRNERAFAVFKMPENPTGSMFSLKERTGWM
jgi:hypothetical protein